MSSIDLGDRYDCLRELGSGGHGRVYLVRDRHLRRLLALKRLHCEPLTAGDLESLQREFALLASLEHPGIARAHDFGLHDGQPYFTTDYIAGPTLAALCPVRDRGAALRIVKHLVEAVAFLHSSGVLHLDIKPANAIAPPPPAERAAVLIDFGIYRGGLEACPRSRAIRGSLAYLAPERLRGQVGPEADVYALGVTLYRLLTGRFPRGGASLDAGAGDGEAAWLPAPSAPSAHGSPLPELDGAVLRCLALEPRARYASAVEVAADIDRLLVDSPAGPLPPASLRILGRDAELAAAESLLERRLRQERGPALLAVTGPPGMGQTRFLRELKARVQMLGVEVFLETGYPARPGPPGSLLRCLGSAPGPEHGAAVTRWRSFLAGLRRPRRPARSEASDGERRARRSAEALAIVSSISRPLVLIADGLERFDEISVAMLIDLARCLAERPAEVRAPLAIVAGYREEGATAGLLRELTALACRVGAVIDLKPLGLLDALALYREHGGAAASDAPTLALLQETSGSPRRVIDLAGGRPSTGDASRSCPAPATSLPTRGSPVHRLLLVTALLERPADLAELARLSAAPRRRVTRWLEDLCRAGLLERVEGSGFAAAPAALEAAAAVAPAARARVHEAIARRLARLDPVEAYHHFQAAGRRVESARTGLLAARFLKGTSQNRAALRVYESVLDALPASARSLRLAASLEAAELHARTGELDQGIARLRAVVAGLRDAPRAQRARALLHLATLHGRKGDCRRAEALFREGFQLAQNEGALSLDERLRFLNERAALKASAGEQVEAVELCAQGLRLAGSYRRPAVREVALQLRATQANVALRGFDHEAALADYEAALAEAEAIGSTASQAAILSNLGIVHSQLDRYEDAVRCYRDAEETATRVDDGPSLVSVCGNRAVLHAKLGDFVEADLALAAAERFAEAAAAPRQRLFLDHARGLCALSRGRHAEARVAFEKAVPLARQVGDLQLAAFEEAYRAEALIFEGSRDEAERGLARLASAGPLRVRSLAGARRAYQAALSGHAGELDEALALHREAQAARPIPYLDAGDALFLAWASSILGRQDLALQIIGPVEAFFARAQLRPGLSLARWVAAEARWLAARQREPGPPPIDGTEVDGRAASDFTAALWPLLAARVLLDRSAGPEQRARCGDLLARAAAALAGRGLPDWSARLEALRASFTGPDDLPRAPPPLPADTAYWRAWMRVESCRVPDVARSARRAGAMDRSDTVELDRPGTSAARSRLVARSQPMRRLVATLDRLRATDLPVLIRGETGTGKELIARIVHEESRRAHGPLQVIDCAALPPQLLEAELFGARAGAFTGIEADRPGLLAQSHGGTALLDEVSELPLEAQAKLLRVLQDGVVRPLGGVDQLSLDVRFLFTTSRDLDAQARAGKLRLDLLHRLRVVTVDVPPLRDRLEDLPDLAVRLGAETRGHALELGRGVLERLRAHAWPGNVRELRNLLARLSIEHSHTIPRETVELALAATQHTTVFPGHLLAAGHLGPLKESLEREYIVHHYQRLGFDTRELCRFLGYGLRQLYRRCSRLGIALRTEARRK